MSKDAKIPFIDHRPWGHYEILLRGEGFQVKRLEIKPGARFSLQKHLKRTEKWTIVQGAGLATIGEKEFSVNIGDTLVVPVGTVHRMAATSKQPLVLIEIQFGTYLEEDDIVRLADDYKRS